jgi:hypothetical protein
MILTMLPEGSSSTLLSLDSACKEAGLCFPHQSLIFKYIKGNLKAKMTIYNNTKRGPSRKSTASF